MTTIGEALVRALEARGVDTVFGIPGVHTVELYRGLARSTVRHVTPRHEQGAGFMADGYARVSGKPGVAFVITGPGVANTLTPMGQARADSVPMLVISGVNALGTLGKGYGHLHELPDQQAMTALVAQSSDRIVSAEDLAPALERAFAGFATGRPGPRHIEVPLDVMPLPAAEATIPSVPKSVLPPEDRIAEAARRLAAAERPLILAGGGAKRAGAALRELAEALDAPVVLTTNARGLMHGHPLGVPASPSLAPVRDLIADADAVLAVGTEFGPTDYDMYGAGGLAWPKGLIRVEVDTVQLTRHPAELGLPGHAELVLPALAARITARAAARGSARAETARDGAWDAVGPAMRTQTVILNAIRDALPGAILVGDSTQVVYAGNLFYDHDRPGGWFNAATGFGALGYGIPAAIGAALADPAASVVALIGDGGAQFTLPELMTAVDEKLPIAFLIWNNHAYGEIASAMEAAGVEVIGCTPTPPDFEAVARSCRMPYRRVTMTPEAVAGALADNRRDGPVMIEIVMPPPA